MLLDEDMHPLLIYVSFYNCHTRFQCMAIIPLMHDCAEAAFTHISIVLANTELCRISPQPSRGGLIAYQFLQQQSVFLFDRHAHNWNAMMLSPALLASIGFILRACLKEKL